MKIIVVIIKQVAVVVAVIVVIVVRIPARRTEGMASSVSLSAPTSPLCCAPRQHLLLQGSLWYDGITFCSTTERGEEAEDSSGNGDMDKGNTINSTGCNDSGSNNNGYNTQSSSLWSGEKDSAD